MEALPVSLSLLMIVQSTYKQIPFPRNVGSSIEYSTLYTRRTPMELQIWANLNYCYELMALVIGNKDDHKRIVEWEKVG